jgi:hypothetical protein
LKAGEVKVMAMAALPGRFSRITVASRAPVSLRIRRKQNQGAAISFVRTGVLELSSTDLARRPEEFA